MNLCLLNVGDKVKLDRIDDRLELRSRLIDMGFTKDSEIECLLKSPFNGPIAYKIKNTVIALRRRDAMAIMVNYL